MHLCSLRAGVFAYSHFMVALESSKLFSRLPAAELKRIRAVARELQFAPGQEIFREGDAGDGVYVVKSGQVQISGVVGPGQSHVFAMILPGDMFGEMAMLDNQPRSAFASAAGETVVYFIPRDEIVALLKHSPDLAITLVQETSGRLREFNRQYVRKVLQAERMALVGRFASSIVHDLKNPLTIIGIASELACLENATPEMRKTAQERIAKQVDRITHLVDDILEFTRGSAVTPAFTEVDYGAFVKGLVEEFQHEVALKAVTIEFENPPPILKLSFNPHRLSRVFYNLILNAVDAMPEGGKIRLRFHITDSEVVTEIEDSGQGIPAEVRDQMFEAFVTFGKARGTGLGLSICKKILEEHQGKISARNQPDGGAVFAFSLPRTK